MHIVLQITNLTEYAAALMRLQDTYKLNASQLASGELSSHSKSKKLSGQYCHDLYSIHIRFLVYRFPAARECYDLGQVAYKNHDLYHTLMWMQEAVDQLNREPNGDTISRKDILDQLAGAMFQVNGKRSNACILII